jgi:hypothetical protein
MIDVIEETATKILEQSPGVVVRYRLLRDVLRKSPDDPALCQARDRILVLLRRYTKRTLKFPCWTRINADRRGFQV